LKPTIYELIKQHKEVILGGSLLSIDPSCSSSKSDPAYALFFKGKLVDNGIIPVCKKSNIYDKLREQNDWIEKSFKDIDVLVVEKIRKGHSYLRWACAVPFVSCRAPLVIEIAPMSWQKYKSDAYIKSDIMDAREIGYAIIKIAKGGK
jgi:hypothetical protein